MMKRLLVICGPTATGKTSLGVKLAKKFDGEIISADSRQVYRGMDIGTGKDVLGAKWVNSPFPRSRRQQARHLGGALELKALSYKTGYYEIDGVKVWLLDMVEPDYQFTVADYVRCTEIVIEDIWKRKKLPILVGGTGFYIKAVVDGIGTMGIPQDKKLRQELSNCQIVKLSNLLKKTDKEKWERMNESDRKNLRRLVRAIEVARKAQNFHLRGVPACHRLAAKQLAGRHSATSQVVKQIPNFEIKADNVLFIGLTANNKVLYERIDRRVDERVKQGIVKEIQGLLKKGYSWENSALGVTIGYKEWRDCFAGSRFKAQGSRPEEEAIQRWKYAEHKYARRQMTWFKKDKRIQWIDITNKKWQDDSKELVESWLSQGTCRKK